ncbi:MAG: NTP transferase domain-containing protein [Bacteroidetes bacterium]|jgi:molybdenum cofactor cytidylyltransferase|nr:NTP transferase domain-containing protein [Bacteroidota bacterium]
MKQATSAVVLAGGKSERMGCPKPYLDFQGKTFIEKIIETYKLADVENITVVFNKNYILPIWKKLLNHLKSEARIIVNDNSTAGRFHSLKLGLDNITETDYCFIQNVDNPFVSPSLINTLYENKIPDAYTVPVHENHGGHPILISKSIIDHIRKIEKSELTLREILSNFKRNEVVVNDPSILFNINTPEDYKKYSLNSGFFL